MTGTDQTRPRVVTFPPSSDCELCRWVLRHYGVAFDEEPNAPPFFVAAVKLRGGKKFPLFLSDTMLINGARPIIDYFELVVPSERKLIPKGLEAQVNGAWQAYNATLGAATVTWAYTYLLPHREVMIEPLSLGTPAYQRLTVKYCYWLPKNLLWRLIKASGEAASAALKVIEKTFEEVDARLADGRPYLLGERLTLADLAFAVPGAPLVVPLGYGGQPDRQGPLPSLEQYPADMQAVVHRLRETRAGQFVLRMYREERYRDLGAAA